jgi:hypothetical protein
MLLRSVVWIILKCQQSTNFRKYTSLEGETPSYSYCEWTAGNNITLMCCMSSSESYVRPPVMICKGMKLQDELTAVRGPQVMCHENGLDNFENICQVAETFYYFFSNIDNINDGPIFVVIINNHCILYRTPRRTLSQLEKRNFSGERKNHWPRR